MRFRRSAWGILTVVTTFAAMLVGLVPAATAASGPVYAVMNTSESPPDGVYFRNSPNTADTARITGLGVYMNEQVQLECYAFGQAVGAYNDQLWYYTLDVSRPTNNGAPNQGMLNAHYINDGQAANVVDAGVPACVNNLPPASAPAPTPVVTLSQGAAAPAGYRYAISLSGFGASSGVSVTCYDSVSTGGFYTFTLTTDGNGAASTQAYCYSGDGPDHWVAAGGVQSNHVSWGGGGTTPPPANPTVSLAQGPAAPAGFWYAINLSGFAAGSGVSVTCFDSASPSGFQTFSLTTDGSGSASTQAWCYSGDGPDHWVAAGGVQSNHVSWGGSLSGGGGGTGGGGTGTGTSPGTTGYVPCHIRLSTSAGARERQLNAMSDGLNSAARSAGVDCQSLAHIIYHEGGNYLSIRRAATQLLELNGPMASVGIGQMTIPTAKLVALQIYRDWETVFDDNIVVRTNLIYELPYALKLAAGYVKVLMNAGISGDFQLFMSYSLSITGAQAWKATGYSMNRSVLSKIAGLRVDTFITRKSYYDQAVRAIS